MFVQTVPESEHVSFLSEGQLFFHQQLNKSLESVPLNDRKHVLQTC